MEQKTGIEVDDTFCNCGSVQPQKTHKPPNCNLQDTYGIVAV